MTSPADHPREGKRNAAGSWAAAMVVLVTLTVMGPICGHDFLWWDDQGTIHQNDRITHPSWHSLAQYWTGPQFGLYMPITGDVWVAIATLAHVQQDNLGINLNPWFFHSASVLGHLIAALLAFRIFRVLNASAWGACCGALVFGIHPLQVETVAWASGLKDVLSAVFGFAAILQYIRFARAHERNEPWIAHYVWATVFYVLTILSKGSLISLPLMVIAIDRWCVRRNWRAVLLAISPWIVVAIPFAIIVIKVQDAINTPVQPLWLRPLIVCDALSFYLMKLLWPMRLAIDYSRNPATVIAHGWLWWDWIFPVGIGALLWIGRKRRPMLLAAGIVFVGGCLTTLGFTTTLYQYFTTVTDHYVYAAMLGPAMAVAWLVSVRQSILLKIATVLVLGFWSATSIKQIRFWQNDYTLFTHAVQVNPNSFVGYGNLGSAFARDDDPKTAVIIFKKAVEANPNYALSYSNLGHAQYDCGDISDALLNENKALAIQAASPTLRPTWARDNRQVGEILVSQKKYAEGEKHLLAALTETPNDTQVRAEWAEAHRLATLASTTTSTAPISLSSSSRPTAATSASKP